MSINSQFSTINYQLKKAWSAHLARRSLIIMLLHSSSISIKKIFRAKCSGDFFLLALATF